VSKGSFILRAVLFNELAWGNAPRS